MIKINLNEYNYGLPSEKIAQYPFPERDGSRLLIYNKKIISEDIFKNIVKFIPSNTLLVFNNARVIRARLLFQKETGSQIELFCIDPLSPIDHSLSFSSHGPVEWKCMIGNQKKWKSSTIRKIFIFNNEPHELVAERLNPEGDAWRIRFSWNSSELTFSDVIGTVGHIPLPPYITRPDEEDDAIRYQTIYSSVNGSVAAPTAGLHFSKDLFDKLLQNGIKTTELTLHVGAGTFQPVKSDNILDHEIHTEHFVVNSESIQILLKNIGAIMPVGTTSVRTLESLYWLGLKILNNPVIRPEELLLGQWEAYEMDGSVPPGISLEALLLWMRRNGTASFHASTKILILPGYSFKMINGIITNFHQPKSTLLLLISAWVGDDWKIIYRHALDNNFRFLSFGDSSLLFR